MREYKVVAGPANLLVDEGNIHKAFDTIADIIKREATNGWIYQSMETITVTEKPGCMMAHPASQNYKMLIFYKERQE